MFLEYLVKVTAGTKAAVLTYGGDTILADEQHLRCHMNPVFVQIIHRGNVCTMLEAAAAFPGADICCCSNIV